MNNDINAGHPPHSAADDNLSPKVASGPSPLGESDKIDNEKNSPKSSSSIHQKGSQRRKLPSQSMGPLKKILLFLVLSFVLYSLAGFFLAPYLLTTTLSSFLAKKLNRPVTIGSAQVNPYTLNITLKNGIIGPDIALVDDKIDPVFSFGRIEGRINPTFFLKKGHLVNSIHGNSVFVHLNRQEDSSLNITALLSRLTTSETAFNLSHLGDFLQAGDINLTDSRLVFTDPHSATRHTLEEISFFLPKRSKGSVAISPHFSAIIDGSPISVGGQSESSTAGQNTRLTFTLKKVNIVDYIAYLPQPLPALITKGEADIELLVDYRISPDKTSHFEISGSGVARDIWLHSPEKSENKISSAKFSLSFAPLLSRLTINKLVLDQPEIQLQRRKDGSYAFPGASQDQPTPSGEPIILETLVVKNGRLSYIDQKIKGGFGAIFNDLNFSMDRSGTDDSSFHAYALNCVTSRKTRIASQGKISTGKGTVNGLLILHNLPMTALNTYLSPERGVTLSSGIIDKAEATLQLSFQDRENNRFTLSNIKGSATNLDIYHQGKEWLHIDQGLFTDATLASDPSDISLGKMTISGLLGHFSPANTLFIANFLSQKKDKGGEPFSELEVKNSTILLDDFSFQKKPAISVKITNFNASDFGKKGNTPGKVDAAFTLAGKGKCQIQGDLSLAPLTGNFQLTIADVPLNIFSSKHMKWFAPEVNGGSFYFNGKFSLPAVAFDGRASLAGLTTQGKAAQNKLINIKNASTPQIHLSLNPLDLKMETLDLDGLELFAVFSSNVNSLASHFFSTEKIKGITKGNIDVQKINLQNSSLHFSDQTLNPPFSKSLTGIHGSLSSLANNSTNSLNLDITGYTDELATLNAKGYINLFGERLGADLNVSLLDQPLDPFIPYLESMASHRINSGIFDLAISYKESAGKVHADTTVTARHLTLGNEDLGNKQLPTILALVTDKDDVIRLDIPVVGDMTAPSYTFHSAFGKKLRSLISRASVSPFSMLSDFYDPEQPAPDHVLFYVGDTEPTPESQPNLLAIKNILAARPQLTVTVKGYSAGTEDRDALLQKRKDVAEKKRLSMQHSLSADLLDSYGQEEIVPPMIMSPGDTSASFTVSKEELLFLAKERCQRIKDILIQKYGIEGNRILISADATVVPESGAGLAGNRADFILGRASLGGKQQLP